MATLCASYVKDICAKYGKVKDDTLKEVSVFCSNDDGFCAAA